MRRPSLLTCIAAAAATLAPLLQAQTSSIAPRVVGSVDDSAVTVLSGNVIPLARAEFDQGAVSPSTELRAMRLVLSRSSEQKEALDQFMAEQLDKSSPNYHKWLTPEQFGRLYGPADSDMAAIVAWLQSHGLSVDSVSPGRTNIAFSGTAQQVEEAFHTPIHAYNVAGRTFLANTRNPAIPAALAAVVSGIAHLATLDPRPHMVAAQPGMFDPQERRFKAGETTNLLARPDLTTGSSTLWLTPADAATIYDTPNSYNAAFSTGTSYTGKGVTIGIGGENSINAATVVNYRKRFLNGNTTAPTITNVNNSAVTGGATDEAYLDNELAGGMAPGATIHFYTADNSAGGLVTAIDQALSDNTVDIFSLSFGLCEYYLTSADNTLLSNMWQQAAGQGIAVTVSTGDNGSAGCDDPSSATSAANGLQVSGWASTPYNIAVGGTDFYGLLGHFSTYVNNNSSSTNSYRSALSYIPESSWNDSVTTDGLLANNAPYGLSSNKTNIIGGSGGVSACSTNTDNNSGKTFVLGTCTSGYAKPSWQRGVGVPSDKARDLPDVSLMAGNGADAATWLVCTDDTPTGGTYPDNCADQVDGNFYFVGYGGTSTSAPAFAGILALVQEAQGGAGHRLGLDGAKTLYDIYNTSHAAAVFHDVTQGNNSVYCTSGTPNCKNNTAGYLFLTGYDTTTGYDLATGLGSVDATQLVKYWNSASGSTKPTLTLTPSATQITTAQAITIAATVSGPSGSATPTGTVTLIGGGYTSPAETLDSTGAYTFSLGAGALTVGTDSLTLTYSGDPVYASANTTTTITVAGTNLLVPTITVTPASASIDTSQSLNVTIAVAGSGGTPTGTVTLSGGGYVSSAQSLDATGTATINIPGNGLGAGSFITLTGSYSGDAVYAGGTATAAIQVFQSSYTLAGTTPSAVTRGSSATSTITVSSTTSYSGNISLACSLTSSPTGASNLPTCSVTAGSPVTLSSSTTSATATVTMNTTAATSANLDRRGLPAWTGAGGGAVLALLFFIGMPARRRSWRNLLGLLILMAALGSVSACGGGGSNGGGGGGNPGTTPGNYTFTVTGTGTPSVSPAPTTTVTLTVN